ncbi:MAG: hypothetical protein WCZ18_03485 [Ottowia sp.]
MTQLRRAVDQAAVEGRDFMRDAVNANAMAQAMTRTVTDYVEQEQAAGRELKPVGTGKAYPRQVSRLPGCKQLVRAART